MTELRSKRSYSSDLLLTWLMIIAALAIVAILKYFDLWAFITIFLLLSIAISSRSFTAGITVDAVSVVIKYHRFFLSKEIIVPANEATLVVAKAVAFRGGAFCQLKVFRKNKLVYTIDSRDGFDKESLEIIAQAKTGHETPPDNFIVND